MSENQTTQPSIAIACNPGAIHPDERASHEVIAREIFSQATVLEIKELSNGYAFRLPPESAFMHNVITFIANERLCCPFFTFTLTIGDQFWLELTGTPEVKAYIAAGLVTAINTGDFPNLLQSD